MVLSKIQGRESYQSILPYLFVMMVVAGTWTWWPTCRFTGWAKHLARGLTYTVIFAPVVIGPEGSYVPLSVTLPFVFVSPFDMLGMLISRPHELLLTFACAVCLSTGIARLRLAWAAKSAPAPDGADSGEGSR